MGKHKTQTHTFEHFSLVEHDSQIFIEFVAFNNQVLTFAVNHAGPKNHILILKSVIIEIVHMTDGYTATYYHDMKMHTNTSVYVQNKPEEHE